MTLKVIGTGFGRTGTLSLKLALEQLNIGPCYHMMEVIPRSEHVPLWADAANGKPVDWDHLFEGFVSTVDWPSTFVWRELVARYPAAKIIHTERDPEVWWTSYSQTIKERLEADAPAPMRAWHDMVNRLITEKTFGGDMSKTNVLKVYTAHNAEVRRTIPPARLLDFNVAQGWAPLCKFLGVPVPETPFPKTNTTADFRARTAAANAPNKH